MGVLGVYNNSVTLINRTKRPLTVRYDGEEITLQPGENAGFPAVAVPYAKAQNPLMGSKSVINPAKFISLVGVKDTKDDCTPFSDETLALADGKYEVVDRSGEFYGEVLGKRVLLRKRGFDPFEAQVEGGSFMDSNASLDKSLG